MNPILEVRNVSKHYAAHTALKEVSLLVPRGSIYGLLGPNGAGKTSLIRILTRITAADSGEVLFNGQPLQRDHIEKIGYLPEERGLYRKMEVGEQLIYLAQLKGLSRNDARQKLKGWVEKFGIAGWWNRKLEELSKGMQQKVQFIATVIHEPELLILDEPFSGFDPINANLITDEIIRLKNQGCSVIFSTHRMESVEQLCEHIALIHQSRKILEGRIGDIRKQYRTHIFEVVYEGRLQSDAAWDCIEQKPLHDLEQIARFRLHPGQSPNQLLSQLIQQVSIVRFEEQVPGMEEIFIRAVSLN
ncbi:MAG: ATP-binding cassette domain-containing protein [Bacteroidia bacterium]|jgi:ABC-2 type transport system ATP-binding protein